MALPREIGYTDEVCAYISRVVAHSELYNPLLLFLETSNKLALGQLNHWPPCKSRQAREEHHVN